MTPAAKPLRLAMSGSAGTGKTTLGRRIAEELGVRYVDERMRERIASGFDLHTLDKAGLRRLIEDDWNEQTLTERGAVEGFVADHASVDYAAFWLLYDLCDDEDETSAWMERMRAAARSYELVVVCPWGSLPLVDDGIRSTNRWHQLRFQLLVEGLLERWIPERLLRVPPTEDFDTRLLAVLDALPS